MKKIAKAIISIMLVFFLARLAKNESKRKKAGKAIILVLLIVILVSLTKVMGALGFFLGSLLFLFFYDIMEKGDYKIAS